MNIQTILHQFLATHCLIKFIYKYKYINTYINIWRYNYSFKQFQFQPHNLLGQYQSPASCVFSPFYGSPTFFSGDFHRCRKLGKSVFPRRLPAGKLIRRQHVAAPVAQMTSPDIFPLFGDSLIFISRLEILDNFCEFLATIWFHPKIKPMSFLWVRGIKLSYSKLSSLYPDNLKSFQYILTCFRGPFSLQCTEFCIF